jgi:hypothetical protein
MKVSGFLVLSVLFRVQTMAEANGNGGLGLDENGDYEYLTEEEVVAMDPDGLGANNDGFYVVPDEEPPAGVDDWDGIDRDYEEGDFGQNSWNAGQTEEDGVTGVSVGTQAQGRTPKTKISRVYWNGMNRPAGTRGGAAGGHRRLRGVKGVTRK